MQDSAGICLSSVGLEHNHFHYEYSNITAEVNVCLIILYVYEKIRHGRSTLVAKVCKSYASLLPPPILEEWKL